MPTDNPGVKPDSARERAKRARSTIKPGSRPASPTRSIEPGVVHARIAEGILRGVQTKAAERGLNLDVGEFPSGPTDGEAGSDDPYRLHRVTTHLVARVGDRFSFMRKVSRHFEGEGKRAGLLSDAFAAAVELYKRNPDEMNALGKTLVTDIRTRQASRVTNQPSQGVTQ